MDDALDINDTKSSIEFHIYFTLIALLLTLVHFILKIRGLPPGPIGLPYIGYWPFLKTETCHLQLQKMKEQYGDISSLTISGHLYINLGSFKVAREAILKKSDVFNSRLLEFNLLKNTFGEGVAFVNGENWKVLRKFFVQKFKERGFSSSKESMCSQIYEAIAGSVNDLKRTNGKPVDISEILSRRCTQIIQQTLFSDEVSVKDMKDVCDSYEKVLINMTGPNLLLVGTLAKCLISPFTHGYKDAMEHDRLMKNKCYEIINKHKKGYDERRIRDIIDCYLKEKHERFQRNDSTAEYFTDAALMSTLLQFIGDGVLTVALFLCAIFRALIDHPEEQDNLYKEIIEVVGLNRETAIEDKNKMPYINAFIYEVMRTTDLFPFFPDLECTKDTTLQGYKIPKGSLLLLNTWSAHLDENEYENPRLFNPNRYISVEGRKRPELPILFGLGKRACMGEGFVMAQAFLFLCTIVKHFHLVQAPGRKGQLMFLVGQLEICAHPRQHSECKSI